jgi:cytochrome b involved in lipid metabolism
MSSTQLQFWSGSRLAVSTRLVQLSRRLTAQAIRLLAGWLVRMADSLEVETSTPSNVLGSDQLTVAPRLEPGEAQVEKLMTLQTIKLVERQRCDSWESTDSGIDVSQLPDNEEEEANEELDPDTGLRILSLEDVSYHCLPEDAWMVVYDKVYDVTEYLRRHPGGEEVMQEYVGYDATMAFRGVGHSAAATRIMNKFLIGILPKHQRLGFTAD